MTTSNLLANHLRLRGIQKGLHDELVDRLTPAALEEAARRLGMWERGRLSTSDESELGLVVDVALFDCFADGQNAVERYQAARKLAPETERGKVLDALSHARLTLLELGAVEPGLGVHAKDLLWGAAFLLCDVALASDPDRDPVIAARVVTFPELSATTGLAMGFDREVAHDLARAFATHPSASKPWTAWSTTERAEIATRILRQAQLEPSEARAAVVTPA